MIKYKIRGSDWLTLALIIVNFNHFFIQPAPGVYSFIIIGNQNIVRCSVSMSYFRNVKVLKCKQSVCLHYGLYSIFKICHFFGRQNH